MEFRSLYQRRHNKLFCVSLILFVSLVILFYRSGMLKYLQIHPTQSLIPWSKQQFSEEYFNSNTTVMDNPQLVEFVREKWISLPSNLPYNLTNPFREDYSQLGESKVLDKLMNEKKDGFFIECGAQSGEEKSVSLFFEKFRRWTGLLVEANPKYFSELKLKNRKAIYSNACLSVVKYPEKVRFQNAQGIGGIEKALSTGQQKRIDREGLRGTVVNSQCFPLFTMLLAINVLTVDLFILDVEGAEADILKTIPFDKVQIDWVYVEHNRQVKSLKRIREVMLSYGYEFVQDFQFNSIYRKGKANIEQITS